MLCYYIHVGDMYILVDVKHNIKSILPLGIFDLDSSSLRPVLLSIDTFMALTFYTKLRCKGFTVILEMLVIRIKHGFFLQ